MGLAALSLLAPACSDEDETPEGTARAFVRAVDYVEQEKLYKLLAPETQKKLAAQAEIASSHTGGRSQLKPAEMLLLGLAKSELALDSLEVLQQSEERARVKLINKKKQQSEILEMVKVKGRWRIVLKL